ncbi:MAG: hypothetical protein HY296_03105 [Thaumarchaeota archaeon]|nr:hypothetical protein [Nitrososphaerota archaeon]
MKFKRVRLAVLGSLSLGLAMLYYGLSFFCLDHLGILGGSSCIPFYIVPFEWVGASLALVSLLVLVFTFRRPRTTRSGSAN